MKSKTAPVKNKKKAFSAAVGFLLASATAFSGLIPAGADNSALFNVDTVEASANDDIEEADLIVPSDQWNEWHPGVNQWVSTSQYRARVEYVHRCWNRKRLDPDVESGFGTDSNANPYTSSAIPGIAQFNYSITSGLNSGVNGQSNIPSVSSSMTTPYGNLVNEIRNTSNWDGRPTELRNRANNLSAQSVSTTAPLSSAQKSRMQHGGIVNVVEGKKESQIAASDNVQERYEERSFECGFDYRQIDSNGRVSRGTKMFANASYLDRVADPDDPTEVNHEIIRQGRHNSIVEFPHNDFQTGRPFAAAYQSGNVIFRYGIPEAWLSAGCIYQSNTVSAPILPEHRSEMIATLGNAPTGNVPGRARDSSLGNGGCGIRGVSIGQDVSYPEVSHQRPYNMLAQILWSYRYWDRTTGAYHSMIQSRAAGRTNTGDGALPLHDGTMTDAMRTTIWENIATPTQDSQFASRAPRFVDEDGQFTESRAFSEGLHNSFTPHKAYQIMHVLCNKEGVDSLLASTSGESVHNGTNNDFSRLVVSRAYSGSSIPSSPDFGANSGNDSANRDFYSKECNMPEEAVATASDHTLVTSQGAEDFGSSESTNHIVSLRDNVARNIVFSIDQNPQGLGSNIIDTDPAYTLLARQESSLGDDLNFSTSSGTRLFQGNDTGPLRLNNGDMPRAYSSDKVELIPSFVNSFDVSSPWVTDSDSPEIVNVSYAWLLDLETRIPDSVRVGSTSGATVNNIETIADPVVPVVARMNVDMGGSGAANIAADINATSGDNVDISNMIPPDSPHSANSLSFSFIRSVSER